MKKMIVCILAGLLCSACSATPSSGVMSCTSTNKNEATTSTVTMELTFEDQLVISQTADTNLTATSADIFDQVKTIAENSEIAYKEIEGTTYQKEVDESTMSLVEHVTLDFQKISKENLTKVISYRNLEELKIDDIQASLEEQGFTCKMK